MRREGKLRGELFTTDAHLLSQEETSLVNGIHCEDGYKRGDG